MAVIDKKVIDGILYFSLYIGCPVCIGQGIADAPGFWRHGGCGGKLYVGSDAYYYCDNCCSRKHVMNYRYTCERHEASEAGREELVEAIGICAQMLSETGLEWYQEFLKNI